jgi:hypothetical protein
VREALAARDLACACCAPPGEVVPVRLRERLDPAEVERYAALRLDEIGLPERDVVTATAPGGAEISFRLGPPRPARGAEEGSGR